MAVLFRVFFFCGLSGSDDLNYILTALDISRGAFTHDYGFYSARIGHVLLQAASISIAGPYEWVYVFVPLLCSIGTVLLVYKLVTEVTRCERIGWLAAVLCAALPVSVVHSTSGMIDAEAGFVCLLTIYFLVRADRSSAKWMWFVAGITFAWGLLVKLTVLVLVPVLLLLLVDRFRKGGSGVWIGISWFLSGVILITVAQGLYFFTTEGDVLFRIHSMLGPDGHEVFSVPPSGTGGSWVLVSYHRLFVDLPRMLLDPGHRWFPYYGLYGYLIVFGILYCGFLWYNGRLREGTGLFLMWGVIGALFLNFAAVDIYPYRPAIPVYPRYFEVVHPPLLVCGAILISDFGNWLGSAYRNLPVVVSLAVLVMYGMTASSVIGGHIRDHTRPERQILSFFSRYEEQDKVVLFASGRSAWVFSVLGANRENFEVRKTGSSFWSDIADNERTSSTTYFLYAKQPVSRAMDESVVPVRKIRYVPFSERFAAWLAGRRSRSHVMEGVLYQLQ